MPTDKRATEAMESVEPTDPARPRSRRALLTAAAAAGGALATQALVRPSPVAAADVVLGATNVAETATTIRTTEKTASAKALIGLVLDAGIAGPSTAGVQGQSNATNGNGLFGVALTGPLAKGAWGRSASGIGVYGEATATTGANVGVRGTTPSTSGVGVHGIASATAGSTNGVYGQVASPAGRGVAGANTATDGTGVYGVAGNGANAKGVYGRTVNGSGVYGEATGSGSGVAVYGQSQYDGIVGVGLWGVRGEGSNVGVVGTGPLGSTSHTGVYGSGYLGVYGFSNHPTGGGVEGTTGVNSDQAVGVRGSASFANAYAGIFIGKVYVNGTLTKTGGSFLIDHPQDPANKTLEHSFVEAPERLNVYRGNVTLDAAGRAIVRMPGYFRALNADYSYQLTPVGAPAPDLHVSREITARSFAVAGGNPGQKVCWIVTGVRQDAWAQKHPLRVERTKRRKDRGKYLNPEAFGKPKSAAMHPVPKIPRRPRRLPRPKAA